MFQFIGKRIGRIKYDLENKKYIKADVANCMELSRGVFGLIN